jgi:hypothetical protein
MQPEISRDSRALSVARAGMRTLRDRAGMLLPARVRCVSPLRCGSALANETQPFPPRTLWERSRTARAVKVDRTYNRGWSHKKRPPKITAHLIKRNRTLRNTKDSN